MASPQQEEPEPERPASLFALDTTHTTFRVLDLGSRVMLFASKHNYQAPHDEHHY